MIRSDADMRRAALDRFEHGVQHAGHRAEWLVLAIVEATLAVEVTEQLVRPVDDVNDHLNDPFG